MQQIPIEEVLAEYRKKYNVTPESNEDDIIDESTVVVTPDAFVLRKNKITFLQIIVIQAITAAVIAAAVIVYRIIS
jgi:hypothetical protein